MFTALVAASAAELRAHRYVKRRFDAAGLTTCYVRFAVPGRGRSRNLVGEHRGSGRCLKLVLAHADSVDDGPGVTLRWRRDSGTGNSDHREFELASRACCAAASGGRRGARRPTGPRGRGGSSSCGGS